MRKKIAVAFIFLLSFFLFGSSPSFAGIISANLELKLARLGSDELQSCLLVMKSQARAEQLSHKLNLRSATRKERHQELLSVLKAEASSSQSEIIKYVQESIGQGRVKEFKTFWITNSIFVRATRDVIEKIASRKDVETIYENYPISLVGPVSVEESSSDQTQKESCFSAIGVREAWSMGYNRKGRLVCNLDTGVDKDHEALFSNWRGNNGGSAAASWFHPYGSDFPQDKKGRGTHTMGAMVGISEEDTIGVAFGAQWIAAGLLV